MDPVDIKILFTFLSILIIFVSLTGFFIVRQQTLAIIERFGKFQRIAHAGLGFRIPLVETISARINLKIQQLDVEIETKTKDDVFIHLMVSVQYHVISEKAFEAYYKLAHPEQQIQAFIFDLVRAEVPKLILDDVFSKKDDIASAVREELQDEMNGFGYQIIKTLITDIQPDEGVKRAMNEINTSQRLRMASMESGRSEYTSLVRLFTMKDMRVLSESSMPARTSSKVSPLRWVFIHSETPVSKRKAWLDDSSRSTKILSMLRTWLLYRTLTPAIRRPRSTCRSARYKVCTLNFKMLSEGS